MVLSVQAYCQDLVYKSGATILNSENQKLSPDQIREIMASNSEAVDLYNSGRNKKILGDFFLFTGIGLMAEETIRGLTSDIDFPTTLFYAGVAATIVALPIRIGYKKRMRSAVAGYNNKSTASLFNGVIVIGNRNGIGFCLNVN
ncbi:hypothetical protein HYN48_12190 [Flavobacterium magnum]|uniref:Uncharacterized protein n=2 Tax=Flavobacterium magnum TaxID=2162713 RepID=A0A2S0RGJ8_9FLAO|nr:hypothetical protein HYN48_12190 [Flavobacterium magnum]